MDSTYFIRIMPTGKIMIKDNREGDTTFLDDLTDIESFIEQRESEDEQD